MVGSRILFVFLFLVTVPIPNSVRASDDDDLVEVDYGDDFRSMIKGEGTERTETDDQTQGVTKESDSKKFSRQQDTILTAAIASAVLFV